MSFLWGWPSINNYNGNGPPWVDWSVYEAFVRNAVAPLRGLSNIVFEVWNEPDDIYFPPGPGYQEFWNGTIEQFYETYLHTYTAIVAELGPGVQVGGPSYTSYDHGRIQDFLEYCLANGCQVNSLIWHALNDSSDPVNGIPSNVQDALTSFVQNPRYAPLHINRIDLNETIGYLFWSQPAGTLQYFSAFERSGATRMARTCGFDDNSLCTDGSLNGLLTADTFQPRSAWWAHKYYADGASARVQSSTQDPSIVALASNGSNGAQPPQILIGYTDYQSTLNHLALTSQVRLFLAHAGPSTPSSSFGAVGVRVEHIPNSGLAVLPQIEFVEDLTVPLASGAGTAILPPLPLGDVYRVTLLTAQTITFAPIANRLFGSSPFGVVAGADSGLAVEVISNTPSVCTIAAALVTLLAPGECSLTASQNGNSSYTAAAPVTRTFFATTACDIDQDGAVGVTDIQILLNEALGKAPAVHDLNRDGLVTVVDTQLLQDVTQGASCKL